MTYLLLTGRHAFDGADGRVVAQEQLDGVVQPPQLLNPEVPPAVAQIVMRALQKDPGARGTAAQFQADIERVLRSAQVVEPIQKPRNRAWSGSWASSWSWPRHWRSLGRSAPSTVAATSRCRMSPA